MNSRFWWSFVLTLAFLLSVGFIFMALGQTGMAPIPGSYGG